MFLSEAIRSVYLIIGSPLSSGSCQQNVTQLTELTELVRGKLSSIVRKSIVALVTQDVHNRDIVETMCIKQCQNVLDFSWQQQLRYYWGAESAEDDLVYKQVD